jgi:hypothetical protein
MNWGLKITILYLAFVAMILTLGFKASGEKVELVTKDYYAQELVHQKKMDAIRSGNEWKAHVAIAIADNTLSIAFPKQLHVEKGMIIIYRPSDSALDKEFVLTPENAGFQTSTNGWPMGYYLVRITWQSEGKESIIEETIFIP